MSLRQTISNYLLANKRAASNKHQFINWVDVTTILVIIYLNQLAELDEFIETCKQDKKEIVVGIIYDGKSERFIHPKFQHKLYTKNMFTWFYIPKDMLLNEMNSGSYNLLINTGLAHQQKSKALTKLINADCKVGNFENDIFDISIVTQKNNSNFFKEVQKYLTMIKTK